MPQRLVISPKVKITSCLNPNPYTLNPQILMQVDESTPFAPLVRGEIGGFAWHLVSDLPATKEASMLAFHTTDGTRRRFHNVLPA